jgi:hypothetical protein
VFDILRVPDVVAKILLPLAGHYEIRPVLVEGLYFCLVGTVMNLANCLALVAVVLIADIDQSSRHVSTLC